MATETNSKIKWFNDTLYTRDIHGNILSWDIRVEEDNIDVSNHTIVRTFGRFNKKQQMLFTNITQGKNIGKQNATTPKTQAIKEAKAMVKSKIKEGYRSVEDLVFTLNDNRGDFVCYIGHGLHYKTLLEALSSELPESRLDTNNFAKPMLATKYKGKAEMPAIVQPKINGVRCFVSMRNNINKGLFDNDTDVILSSSEGLEYDIPHIKEAFRKLYAEDKVDNSIVFDGELFIFDKPVTDIAGAARNKANPINDRFVYVCFDLAISELSNIERDELRSFIFNMTETLNIFENKDINIINLNSINISNQDEVIQYTDTFISWGYEGCIIRQPQAEYQFGKRRVTMQKSKKFFDSEFTLIDIIPAEKDTDSLGRAVGLFVCKNDNSDATFTVTPHGYTKKDKANMLKNKEDYIGKDVTVKYYERTKTGLPFHANGHIRDYK